MINAGIRRVAVWPSHPVLEELLSDVVELQKFHKTSRTWRIKKLAAVLFGSCVPFLLFFPIHTEVLLPSIPWLPVLGCISTRHLGTGCFCHFFFFGHHRGTSASHLILECVTDRAKQFLLFCVKGSSSSWKSCVFSGISRMEYSSVWMAVYICINKYLWSQLQGFDAKIILFLGRGENFKKYDGRVLASRFAISNNIIFCNILIRLFSWIV